MQAFFNTPSLLLVRVNHPSGFAHRRIAASSFIDIKLVLRAPNGPERKALEYICNSHIRLSGTRSEYCLTER